MFLGQNKDFYKRLFSLTLPLIFQSLMLALVGAADSFMLGQYEQNAMSAVSLATQIQFVQNSMIFSFVGTAMVLGAQYWGKREVEPVEEIFAILLRLSGIFSLIVCLLCEVCPSFLMGLYTDKPELVAIGVPYLRIAGFSYFLTGINQSYFTIMKVTDKEKTAVTLSSCTVVLNILLNAVFIFGLFGITPMGADGAALATLISRIAETVVTAGISMKKGYLHPTLSKLLHRNRLLSRDFYKCLLPMLGGGIAWTFGFTLYTSVMGHLDTDATAAHAIAAVVMDLTCCFCNGFGASTCILVGNELGKGDLKTAKSYGGTLVPLSFLLGGLCCGLILLFSRPLINLFTLTDRAKEYLFGMLIIVSVYMIARTFSQITINGIFYAGGDTKFDIYSLFVCMWCMAVPLCLLGGYVWNWPAEAVYACTCLDEVIKIPWVLYHYKKYKWVKDLTRSREELEME